MRRGRKPRPCPDYDKLRELATGTFHITALAAAFGASSKAVIRWLGEIGVEYAVKAVRPRGVTPRYVKVGRTPDGRRIWSKLYGVWNAMRGRCKSPGTKDYIRYGARGIRVCDEWNEFDAFRSWALSSGFRKGLTLDREDSNGNYEPSNCRWIPKGEQQDNTRWVHRLTLNGVTRPITQWARITGMKAKIISSRLKLGWTDEQAITLPVGTMRPGMLRGRAAAKAKRLALQSSEDSAR